MRTFGLNKREVAEVLREQGINPTTQRVEIAHLLLQRPQHLAADEILQQINAEYEQVSQATVYNTLRLFVSHGVVQELAFSSDRIYYDSNVAPHHHFVDCPTGTIVDVPLDSVQLPQFSLDDHGFEAEVEQMSLVFRGRLKKTAAASESTAPR